MKNIILISFLFKTVVPRVLSYTSVLPGIASNSDFFPPRSELNSSMPFEKPLRLLENKLHEMRTI